MYLSIYYIIYLFIFLVVIITLYECHYNITVSFQRLIRHYVCFNLCTSSEVLQVFQFTSQYCLQYVAYWKFHHHSMAMLNLEETD